MMPAAVTTDPAALAASIAHWWALAGVDTAVQDFPRDWLTKMRPAAVPAPLETAQPVPEPAAIAPSPAPLPVPAITPAPMPQDLEAFLAWLANDPAQPEAVFSGKRILPRVQSRPEMLVITDMPTQEDMVAGHLFSSADAGLLSGMLRAIGVEADKSGMASLLLARPAGGIIEDGLMQRATERLLHFIGLISPRAILFLGDKTSRAFEQVNNGSDSLSTPLINHDDGTISVLPLPAPFVLLRHPERKAAAWVELRQLAKR